MASSVPPCLPPYFPSLPASWPWESTRGSGKLKRAVSEREVEEYARTKDARVFLTSAKTGLGVEELFQW